MARTEHIRALESLIMRDRNTEQIRGVTELIEAKLQAAMEALVDAPSDTVAIRQGEARAYKSLLQTLTRLPLQKTSP